MNPPLLTALQRSPQLRLLALEPLPCLVRRDQHAGRVALAVTAFPECWSHSTIEKEYIAVL